VQCLKAKSNASVMTLPGSSHLSHFYIKMCVVISGGKSNITWFPSSPSCFVCLHKFYALFLIYIYGVSLARPSSYDRSNNIMYWNDAQLQWLFDVRTNSSLHKIHSSVDEGPREQGKNLGSPIYGMPHCLHTKGHICWQHQLVPVGGTQMYYCTL